MTSASVTPATIRSSHSTRVSRWPFEKARRFARALKLKTSQEYLELVARKAVPEQMPPYPPDAYMEQWRGWADFLGDTYEARAVSAPPARVLRPFEEVRAEARKLGIPSPRHWLGYARRPDTPEHLRLNPRLTYAREFRGWEDFLGYSKVSRARKPRDILTFEEARKKVQSLGLRSILEYSRHVAQHPRSQLPTAPQSTYRGQWRGWKDFFGTSSIAVSSRPSKPYKLPKELRKKPGRRPRGSAVTHVLRGLAATPSFSPPALKPTAPRRKK